MKTQISLFVLVLALFGCGTGISTYRNPLPSPMVSPTLAQGENPCGLYLDPSGATGAFQSQQSFDLLGLAPTMQASATVQVMDAAGRYIERCSNGSARVIMAHGFAQAWKHPFSSNPVWQNIGLGMNNAADKEAERARVEKVYKMYMENVKRIKGGKGSAPAEVAPTTSPTPSTSPAPASTAPTASPTVSVRTAVANATSLPDIAAALSAEAQKGGSSAAQYQSIADSISALPATTDVQAEKTKILKVLPR